MGRRRKNNLIIVSLCAVLVLMGIGYAAFSSVLNITGTSNITSNWDVRITNIESELHGAEDVEAPTYDNTNGLYASFNTNLKKPGDYALYKIKVENQGTLDARIEKINSYYKDNKYITFTLTGLSKGDIIEAKESKILTVKVEFNPDITSIDGDITVDLDVSIDIAQDSDNPLPTDDYYLTYDYETNGGTSTTASNGFVNGSTSLEGTATKEGYEFVGWNTDKNATNKMDEITVTENTTVYAIFRKALNVTYNKVTGVDEISKTSDTCYIYNNNLNCNITLPTITPSKGYTSLGWSKGEEVFEENSLQTISEDVVYTAKVEAEKISPEIVLNPNNQSTYTNGTEVTVTLSDKGSGLKANQNVYYAWSESNTEAPSFTDYVEATNEDGAETTEITIPASASTSLTGTYYLWIKEGISDMLGNSSQAKVSEAFNFDSLNPEISNVSTSKTTNSITVVATAGALSGISKYEYSSDNGSSWKEGTENSYTFTGLTHNKTYNIKVRVTSGVGKTTTSNVTTVTTNAIDTPTFSESGTTTKTVTITYPSGCGNGLACSYQKDSGSWTTVTSSTTTVSFSASGTLVAKVTDGTNTVTTASYSVIILDQNVYLITYNSFNSSSEDYYIEKLSSSGTNTFIQYLSKSDVPYGITTDADNIYYLVKNSTSYYIIKISKSGGTETTLTSFSSTSEPKIDTTVSSDYIYFTQNDIVKKISKTGGTATQIYTLSKNESFIDLNVDDSYIYVAIDNSWVADAESNYIKKVSISGGTATQIYTKSKNEWIQCIDVYNNYVYIALENTFVADAESEYIKKISTSGGTTTQIYTKSKNEWLTDFAVNNNYLYIGVNNTFNDASNDQYIKKALTSAGTSSKLFTFSKNESLKFID